MIDFVLATLLSLAGNDEPKPPKPAPRQGDNAKVTADELKTLKEHNIFSPPKKKPDVKPPKTDDPKPPKVDDSKPAPKMLSVTGFFRDETENCFKVLIEDRTWKDNKYKVDALHMLKVGEEIAGGKIVDIRLDSFDHEVGEAKKTYHAGDQVEVPGSVSSGATKPTENAQPANPTPADPKVVEDKMKELKERFKGKKKFDDEPEEETPGKKKRG